MAYTGINFSEATFMDGFGARSGWATIALSGNTGNTGSAMLRLDNIDFNFNNNLTTLQSFDSDFQEVNAITTQAFDFTAEGFFTAASRNGYSGQTGYVTGSYNAEQLLVLATQRRADVVVYHKVGSKILKLPVVIGSWNHSGGVGAAVKFTLNFSSNGQLIFVA